MHEDKVHVAVFSNSTLFEVAVRRLRLSDGKVQEKMLYWLSTVKMSRSWLWFVLILTNIKVSQAPNVIVKPVAIKVRK